MATKQIVLTFIVLAGLAFVAGSNLVAQQKAQQNTLPAIGRYALLQGEYIALLKEDAPSVHTVFKIDTATGRAWRYQFAQDNDGKVHEGWEPIKDAYQ